MSYDLHITKADHWIYSHLTPITEEEMSELAELMEPFKGIPFLFTRGRITLCGADKRVIGLMITIAERIGARVQGDDGEYYDNTSDVYPLPPDSLRQDFNESWDLGKSFSVSIGDDSSMFINTLRIALEERAKRNEVLSELHGQSDNWKVDLAHMGSGKVNWKLTYTGNETIIRLLIYNIVSNHCNRSDSCGGPIDRTKDFVYEWTTYLGKNGKLHEESILLQLRWSGHEEEIVLP